MSVVGGGVQHSQLSEIQENQTSESQEKPQESDNNDTVSPLLEEEQPGKFRTRAASAGQQARAHVSQIVARFRNRSNSSASEDKEKIRLRKISAVNMAVTDTIQGGLLENFRPRSKSDATRSSGGIRRPNSLSHLKGEQRRSVQVSVV